jgi:hypothetical protein
MGRRRAGFGAPAETSFSSKQKITPKAFARHGGQAEQAKERKILFCPNLEKSSLPSLPSV